MTRGEILFHLYCADLYLRVVHDRDRKPGEPTYVSKMFKISPVTIDVSRHPIQSREGTSKHLKTLFLEFNEEFLVTYLKKLRPRAKLFTIIASVGWGPGITKMYQTLNELDIPYFVTLNYDRRISKIVFLNETDSVVAAAAIDV